MVNPTTKQIKLGLVEVAQRLVGDKLYIDPKSKQPVVYFARKNIPPGNYPFIIVDLLTPRRAPDNWQMGVHVEDCVTKYASYSGGLFSFQIYDKEDESAVDTINLLHNYMVNVPSVRRFIYESTGGARLERVFAVEDVNFKDKEGHKYSYRFNFSLVYTTVVEDPLDNNFINTITLDGEMLQREDDPEPYTFTLDFPPPQEN